MQINDQPITVEPRETVLQAALRGGIEFPNSCRVDAYGTFKCRLAEGDVQELTETGYLLSAAVSWPLPDLSHGSDGKP